MILKQNLFIIHNLLRIVDQELLIKIKKRASFKSEYLKTEGVKFVPYFEMFNVGDVV